MNCPQKKGTASSKVILPSRGSLGSVMGTYGGTQAQPPFLPWRQLSKTIHTQWNSQSLWCDCITAQLLSLPNSASFIYHQVLTPKHFLNKSHARLPMPRSLSRSRKIKDRKCLKNQQEYPSIIGRKSLEWQTQVNSTKDERENLHPVSPTEGNAIQFWQISWNECRPCKWRVPSSTRFSSLWIPAASSGSPQATYTPDWLAKNVGVPQLHQVQSFAEVIHRIQGSAILIVLW